jgi:hypothetical protein
MKRFAIALLMVCTAACGGASDDATDDGEEVRSTDPDRMPSTIVGFEDRHNWGDHHLEWHMERRWDSVASNPQDLEWAQNKGWKKAQRQEGDKGNGLEFLIMHRAMMEVLRENFPRNQDLFVGFDKIPTDPRDRTTPCPSGKAFDPKMVKVLTKLDAIADNADDFADDDAFGLYIETSIGQRKAGAGIHNYLHVRFSKEGSSIDVGDPTLNLKNRVFWRIHGFIDRKWSEFRKAKGLPPEDRDLRRAIDEQKRHMTLEPRSVPAGTAQDDEARDHLRQAFKDGLKSEFE